MVSPWLVRGVFLLALVALTACGSSRRGYDARDAQPRNVDDACAIFAERPHWRSALEDASDKWGTPIEVKLAIIWRESRFVPNASPGTSSAYGFAQAIDGTWDWYRDATGNRRARRDDFGDSADFVGWYMNRTRDANGLSFYDPYRQYLAYHDGHTGYARGDWRSDFILQRAAQEVQTMAARFRAQLATCS
ncbi:MAG: transglycosylase SLT domain-containing protein [Rubricella sp.]